MLRAIPTTCIPEQFLDDVLSIEEVVDMYKILNSQGLGVAGRQNELIELALTYGFDGVDKINRQ